MKYITKNIRISVLFKMLLLTLLLGTNVGYAASAEPHSSLDAKIAALRDMPPSKSLTLVLGSTPGEVGTSDRRTFHSNVDVYTLGVSSYFLNADEKRESVRVSGLGPGESRWLEVDFNDSEQMAKLATNLKGRFKVICFDLHVLKFFKNWGNLRFLQELLQDDGVFYVPDPQGSTQKIYITAKEMQENFTRDDFKLEMIRDDAIKIPLIKDIFQKYFSKPTPIDVLVAVKRATLFPNFIKRPGETDPASEIIPPPYTKLSAPKVIGFIRGDAADAYFGGYAMSTGNLHGMSKVTFSASDYKATLRVSDVRTCISALEGRPLTAKYYVTIRDSDRTEPLRMYVLEGVFYNREDTINKILAAESTILEVDFGTSPHIKNTDLGLTTTNSIKVLVRDTKGTPWSEGAEAAGTSSAAGSR